jgi:hypothetical protein
MIRAQKKADLHVHSSHSFDVPDLDALRPRTLFEAALGHADPARRMDWFALTDHDTMSGWEELVASLGEADRRLVVPGVEHTLQDPSIGFTLHVNLYRLDPDLYARLRRETETLDDLVGFCAAHGILYQYNHPTWWERRELRTGAVDFSRVIEIARRFPVLELNAARTTDQNLITAGLAAELGKPLTASSDTHTGGVGRGWTAAPGETVDEFLDAVWRGEGDTHLEALTYTGLVDEAHGLIDELILRGDDARFGREASSTVQTYIEGLGGRILQSAFLRNPAARNSMRTLLRGVTRPIMHVIMENERRLERRLAASDLQNYLERTRAINAA